MCPLNDNYCSCHETTIELPDIEHHASQTVAAIRDAFPGQPTWVFAAGVTAEAGEFMSAYLRYTGKVRRAGHLADVAGELADVVICTFRAAHVLGISLPAAISGKLTLEKQRGFGSQQAPSTEPAHDVPAER